MSKNYNIMFFTSTKEAKNLKHNLDSFWGWYGKNLSSIDAVDQMSISYIHTYIIHTCTLFRDVSMTFIDKINC